MRKNARPVGSTLTGRHARRIDLEAWVATEQAASPEFAEAFAEARQATEVARTLAGLRLSRGLSQGEVARRIGTSQQAVSRMENPGYRGHTVRMMVRYAAALGARVEFRVVGASAKGA